MQGSRRHDEEPEQLLLFHEIQNLKGRSHPFYNALNKLLSSENFDERAEELCRDKYCQDNGRPSVPIGVYFRMIMAGYFEGFTSIREICWRCEDSLSLRKYIGLTFSDRIPDHSSMTKIRQRLGEEIHEQLFQLVLRIIRDHGLLNGSKLGIDSTTVEASAAMRKLLRKETGEDYQKYIKRQCAEDKGIANPSTEEAVRHDRKRPNKKMSNKDWESPTDPDAKIAKTKKGSTRLAHKVEIAVDLETEVILGVSVHGADRVDSSTMYETLDEMTNHLEEVLEEAPEELEIVADKGYHSDENLTDAAEGEIETNIAAPKGHRVWKGADAEERRAAYEKNQQNISSERGKELMKKRANYVERAFAHLFETGGLRRMHLRGHDKIMCRLLLHVAAFNLGVLMRKIFGIGKPRTLQDVKGWNLSIFIEIFANTAAMEPRMERWTFMVRRLRTAEVGTCGPSALAA